MSGLLLLLVWRVGCWQPPPTQRSHKVFPVKLPFPRLQSLSPPLGFVEKRPGESYYITASRKDGSP